MKMGIYLYQQVNFSGCNLARCNSAFQTPPLNKEMIFYYYTKEKKD